MYKSLKSTYLYDYKGDALKAFAKFIKNYAADISKISFRWVSGDEMLAPDGYLLKVTFIRRRNMKELKTEFKGVK